MYSSRGNNNAYGQQSKPYSGQSSFGQNPGPEGSRHSSLLGSHSSAGGHYGGQYTSVYGSSAHSSALQVPATSTKGAGSSLLRGRSGYGSTLPDSPTYTPEYPASSHKYGQKGEAMYSDDRLPYAERATAYSGRDLHNDSIAYGHQHKTDIYDRLDAAAAIRQELLHSASVDGSPRQADYLAARSAAYGGRYDTDLHALSMMSGREHAPSILGAPPRREVEDLMYAANPGYGVSLPPGRAYVSGKSLRGTSLEPDYPDSILARGGYSRLDDRVREREHEILRERERERDRERERLRERERERERERRKERERMLERRERERERESRRDRTPLRISKDRGRSTSAKPVKSSRRESPRHLSPVKEKRREYVCKVSSSNLVEPERDYLSMDKRYPKLYVSPECSKVVVNWSREDLKIPFHTPVSFEHDFVQEETPREHKSVSTKTPTNDHAKLESRTTRWNAKLLLMSGLSRNAWEELSSERKYEDRIPHLCNMLRFAFLKEGNISMAIGGSWDAVDGNDPLADKSALVQTVLRHTKELTGLDLKNCRKWNPFLEIHYDRIGKDGLFSHKEITVLFIPDLSDCLPSIDAWKNQWLAHKKAVAERERLNALKQEKLREKKEVPKDKETEKKKDDKVGKTEKKKEAGKEGSESKVNGKEKVGTKVKVKEAGKEGDGTVTKKKDGEETTIEMKDGDKTVTENKEGDKTVTENKDEDKALTENKDGDKAVNEKEDGDKAGTEKEDGDKTVTEKEDGDKTITEKNDGDKTVTLKKDEGQTVDEGENSGKKNQTPGSGKKKIVRKVVKKKIVSEKDENAPKQNDDKNTEVTGEDAESSGTPVTATKKNVVKKTPVVKTVKEEDEAKELECSEDKTKNEDVVGASDKPIVKKKIIKKVTKKKVAVKAADNKDKAAKENEAESTVGEQSASEVKLENESVSETVPQSVGGLKETGIKSEKNQVKEEKKVKVEGVSEKNEKLKDGKEKKDKDVKTETRGKEVKDKKKVEEPPRHPGLILQIKGNKSSKLRSLSLSLDSLLDYTDKDIEESTFELSVFAETFYEMLQFQMGSRILTFLQKLRIKFVAKMNQKKRRREEASDKKEKEKTESAKKSSPKRQKTDDVTDESKPVKTETLPESGPVEEKTDKDENMVIDDNVDNIKAEDKSVKDEDSEEEPEEEPEEDLEEDPEEDENMADAEIEEKAEADKVDTDVKSEKADEKVKGEQEEDVKTTVHLEKKENQKVDAKKKETTVAIDKKLLEAFRFFDRNRLGFIRVEDLRLILHALGHCMSHRDVKELVQSALLESNSGRDGRVLYNKLVKMTDI